MELENLETGRKSVDTPLGNFTVKVIESLEEKIPAWSDINRFLSKAIGLILLSAFTEKRRAICDVLGNALASGGTQKPRRRGGESRVDSYIRHINEGLGLSLIEPPTAVCIRVDPRASLRA